MGWAERSSRQYDGTKGAQPLTARPMVLQALITPQKTGRKSRRWRKSRWVPR
jgi:hypothetical protein